MKILLLGGGGFLGSHISESLIQKNHSVTIFDMQNANYLDYASKMGANIITGDFHNHNGLSKMVKDSEIIIDLIYGTLPQESNEDPQFDIQTNVVGFLNLLDILREMPGKRIIYPSSGGTVYGIPKEVPIKETHPTNPICSYGISKLTIEKYLHLYWTLFNLDYCILRIGNAYGERQPTNGTQGIIGTFLENAVSNEEIVIWGDGNNIRDYIYVGDVAAAFVNALEYKGEPRIFNIGSGKGHSVNEIAETIQNITGIPLKLNYLPPRKFDVPSNVLDISRAQTYLDWEPKISLREGISRAYREMN
jgi:UDP-glucose 4-epimerase